MAEFRVASVFSDHMVLQRNKNVKVFGYGDNGQRITVNLLGNIASSHVLGERWIVVLPEMDACQDAVMTVTDGTTAYTYTDIAIGEVWLAGGQSNMEFELKNCIGGKEMLKNDKMSNVRFYHTPKKGYKDEDYYIAERNSSWEVFDEESSGTWSAVGYVYAKRIAKELGVTVGIIGCNWGGTSASTWIDRKALEVDTQLNTYVEEYEASIKGKTMKQQMEEYDEYLLYQNAWDERCGKLYEEEPSISWSEVLERLGENKWPGPLNCKNPYRPGGLYECMLQRVMPYTLRGFLYYQGESDDHKPNMYYKLLTRMIQQWRDDWEEDTLPFLFVQLPMHRNASDPDYKHWPFIREAQMKTFQTIRNTGLAVIIDCGVFNDIHPKDKVPVGERLALQAMYHVYGLIGENEAFGPIYKSCRSVQDEMELSFDYAKGGFVSKGQVTGFEIADDRKEYMEAKIRFEGEKIYVSCDTIKEPKFVRYLWTNYSDVTVFGINGLPLAPFRTSMKD